jgi:hypothetical protein
VYLEDELVTVYHVMGALHVLWRGRRYKVVRPKRPGRRARDTFVHPSYVRLGQEGARAGAALALFESLRRSCKAFIFAAWTAANASLVALRSSAAAKQIVNKRVLPLRLLDEGLKGILLELAEASERIIINALRVEIDGCGRGGVL